MLCLGHIVFGGANNVCYVCAMYGIVFICAMFVRCMVLYLYVLCLRGVWYCIYMCYVCAMYGIVFEMDHLDAVISMHTSLLSAGSSAGQVHSKQMCPVCESLTANPELYKHSN